MSPGWIVGLELTAVLGVVLGLAVRELLSLRHDRERPDDIAPRGEQAAVPAPDDPERQA